MTRISRFAFACLTLAAVLSAAVFVSPPVSAEIETERLIFRTTTAGSSIALNPSWVAGGNSGYTDSSVVRRIATALNVDTTAAYPLSRFTPGWPSDAAIVVNDSTGVAWMVLTLANDRTSYSWAGTTGMDSVYVTAQVSIDGVSWATVDGTPTREFFAADVSPTAAVALVGIEQVAGVNAASVLMNCEPGVTSKADRLIINRNLCSSPGYVRFIISVGAGTGQFQLLATYQK